MFQLDPGFSAAALDEFVADVTAPVAESKPVLVGPVVANENQPSYNGPGTVAWEDDEYYYVFDD